MHQNESISFDRKRRKLNHRAWTGAIQLVFLPLLILLSGLNVCLAPCSMFFLLQSRLSLVVVLFNLHFIFLILLALSIEGVLYYCGFSLLLEQVFHLWWHFLSINQSINQWNNKIKSSLRMKGVDKASKQGSAFWQGQRNCDLENQNDDLNKSTAGSTCRGPCMVGRTQEHSIRSSCIESASLRSINEL